MLTRTYLSRPKGDGVGLKDGGDGRDWGYIATMACHVRSDHSRCLPLHLDLTVPCKLYVCTTHLWGELFIAVFDSFSQFFTGVVFLHVTPVILDSICHCLLVAGVAEDVIFCIVVFIGSGFDW